MNEQGNRPTSGSNGAAAAALLAAGIGSFALALLTVLGRYAGFVPPDLYPPVGSLTGKVGLALLAWLVAWAALQARWGRGGRRINLEKAFRATLLLTALGLLGTLLPFVL